MNHSATSEPKDIATSLPPIPYPDDLYRFDTVANSISGGFSAVTDADIDYFHQYGYLVIEDAFTSDEVRDAIAGMVYLMNGKNPDFRAIQFEPKLAKLKDEMDADERRDAIRKIFNFVNHEPRFKNDGCTRRTSQCVGANYARHTYAFSRHGVG